MNQLFNIGKGLIKNGLDANNNNSNKDGSKVQGNDNTGGGFDSLNPMAMFKQLDRNGDGKITVEGLGAAGEQTARLIFSQIDTNNNGVLELSEAMRAFEQVKKLLAMANKTPAVPAATTS